MFTHLDELTNRLKKDIRNGDLNQSVLLVGRPGTGKFSLAMEIARSVFCENDMTACGECRSCKETMKFQNPDFLFAFPFPNLKPESRKLTVFSFSDQSSSGARFSEDTKDEIERFKETKSQDPFAILDFDKKENIPVDVIKDLIRALSKKPLRGGRRVVVILDIDKMAFGASDLFLKTVEEPPENTHLVLTTSHPDQLLPTLLSRTSIIKVPPAPSEELEKYLSDRLKIDGKPGSYLARISGGSPGQAVHLFENDIIERRNIILDFFGKLLGGYDTNLLAEEINNEYSGPKIRFNDTRMDFEIMESLIHDLYLIGENGLENQILNVDIRSSLEKFGRPDMESLDIWRKCCGETRRACLVNNVTVSTAMLFFYITSAEALNNPAAPKYKLP